MTEDLQTDLNNEQKEIQKNQDDYFGKGSEVIEFHDRKNGFKTSEILAIGKKSNYCCAKCKSNDNLHIHHITPLSRGGDNSINNLIILCKFCHKIVHKKKGEFYNEEEYYNQSTVSYAKKDIVFDSSNYLNHELGWGIDTDCTDHFIFTCPKCKKESIISSIKIVDYNSLDTPPCFYFKLKCGRCKLIGQRKIYVNYGLTESRKIKEERDGD